MLGKKDLCDELKVLLQIFEMSAQNKEAISFYKLVKILDGRVSKVKISQVIDRLFDKGILTVTYHNENNEWDRIYYITGEAEDFVKSIYNKTVIK